MTTAPNERRAENDSSAHKTGAARTESRNAFEEWFNPRKISETALPLESALSRNYAIAGWQASEARIRAMLESEEMVEMVEQFGYKAALKAIVEGI